MVGNVFSGVWMPHYYSLPVKLAISTDQKKINGLTPAFTGRIGGKKLAVYV